MFKIAQSISLRSRWLIVISVVCLITSVYALASENCSSHAGVKKDKPDDVVKKAQGHAHDDKEKQHGAEEKTQGHAHDDKEKSHGAAEKGKGHEGEKESEEAAEVKFTPEMIKKNGIETGMAAPGVIYKSVSGPGEILMNDDKVAHISPKVSGVAVKIFKSLGDKVAEGETLAIFESSGLGEAKIEYYTAKTKFALARLDYDRNEKVYQNTKALLEMLKNEMEPSEIIIKTKSNPIGEVKTKLLTAYSQHRQLEAALARTDKLYSKGVVSMADLELKRKESESANAAFRGAVETEELGIEQTILKSRREFMIAETALSNAERKLYMIGLGKEDIAAMEKKEFDRNVSSYHLKSPIGGVVIERHLANGEHAAVENDCFTVADLSSLWCDIRIRPRDFAGITRGGKAVIKADSGNFMGEITTIAPTIDDKTRAGFVRVTIKNTENILRPGLFVDGKIMVSATPVKIAVPTEAVQTFEGKEVVFKQGCEANEFVVQPITRGAADELSIEVLDGLKSGDIIAIKGTFIIKAEFAKGAATGCSDSH